MKNPFAHLFGRPKHDLVPYYDFETRTTARIPKAELRPGLILIQIEGQHEPVYADPTQLEKGPHRHEKFTGEDAAAIQGLVDDLADVYAQSYDEWEDGFRRDHNPSWEIASWVHLATVLNRMTVRFDFSPEKRRDCFRVLLACSTGERATVRERSDPKFLSPEEVQAAMAGFFDGLIGD